MAMRFLTYIIVASSSVLAVQLQHAVAQPAVPGQAAPGAALQQGQPEPQVLEQGPIHEAFAEPIALDAQPQVSVDRAPPDPVNEVPPEVRPDGQNVEWIPGYWMWSDQQQDFVWVSGVWRDIPPGRRWVPGHWTKADGGFMWVSGFWAGANIEEAQLLPHPPASLEAGPTSDAPGENYFWIPGIWTWQNDGYAWRPGYWYEGHQNWVWVPDHYCYTPRGSIYISGYWDYPLVNRGLLYAPVYWPASSFGYPALSYRPYSVINASLLLTSLFINDRYHNYYYGFGRWGRYADHYHPWWDRSHRRHIYDPFYAYHRWHDGRNRNDWHDHIRNDWNRHRDDRFAGGPGRDGRPGGRGPFDGRGPGDRQLIVPAVRYGGIAPPTLRLREANREELQAAAQKASRWEAVREARRRGDSTLELPGGGRLQLRDRSGEGIAGQTPGGQPGVSRQIRPGDLTRPGQAPPNAGRTAGDEATRQRLQGQGRDGQFGQRRNVLKPSDGAPDTQTPGTLPGGQNPADNADARQLPRNRGGRPGGDNVIQPGPGRFTQPGGQTGQTPRDNVIQPGPGRFTQPGGQSGQTQRDNVIQPGPGRYTQPGGQTGQYQRGNVIQPGPGRFTQPGGQSGQTQRDNVIQPGPGRMTRPGGDSGARPGASTPTPRPTYRPFQRGAGSNDGRIQVQPPTGSSRFSLPGRGATTPNAVPQGRSSSNYRPQSRQSFSVPGGSGGPTAQPSGRSFTPGRQFTPGRSGTPQSFRGDSSSQGRSFSAPGRSGGGPSAFRGPSPGRGGGPGNSNDAQENSRRRGNR